MVFSEAESRRLEDDCRGDGAFSSCPRRNSKHSIELDLNWEFYRRGDTLVKQMVGAFGLLGPVLFGEGAWIRRGGLM